MKQYRIRRVLYGVASSALHATRALQEVGNLSKEPLLQRTIKRDFYIDDLLTGANTPEVACKLQQDVTASLALFGMPLRKWTSSNVTILQQLDDSMCELTESVFVQDPTFSIKTLGIRCFQRRMLSPSQHDHSKTLQTQSEVYFRIPRASLTQWDGYLL